MRRLATTALCSFCAACAVLLGACSKDNPLRPALVDVTASVGPTTYVDRCPGVFEFTAEVTSTAGTVTYRWERSDGGSGPTETLNFSGAGTQTIADSWQLDAIGSFWERVHILTPKDTYSNQAAFTNACGAIKAAVSSPSVSPSAYSDGCPGTFHFAADITLNGAGNVTYQWQRSNGTHTPTATLSFTGAGTKTVTDSWQLSATGSFSEQLHILTPSELWSSSASFSNTCGAATAASARVTPTRYSGDCPGVFDFAADLTASAGTLTYRWERSDGTSGPDQTLRFAGSGTQTVTESWQSGAIGSHWARAHVLSPNDLVSNAATFTNDCGALGPFLVTAVAASVSPGYNDGYCPSTYTLSASIAANGDGGVGTVTYRWERSDNTFGPTQTLAFTGPGTQTVTDTWEVAEDGSFWGRVHILTPNDLISNEASFSNGCCFFCDAASTP